MISFLGKVIAAAIGSYLGTWLFYAYHPILLECVK